MSFIVKGMDMPINCFKCPLSEPHYSDGKRWCRVKEQFVDPSFDTVCEHIKAVGSSEVEEK